MSGEKENWVTRFKGSWAGISVGALIALVATASTTTDAVDKLMVSFGWKPNALALAEDDRRGQLSRDLTRQAWRRLFWTRRVLLAEENKFPDSERNETWSQYLKTVEDWNSDLMVNILALNKYYTGKGYDFEYKIQPSFGRIHYCLEGVRHPETKISCAISDHRDLSKIKAEVDNLNGILFGFVCGLPNSEQKCSL